jgi:RimJ/RimL family protein N-acetyltransferase
MARNGHAETGGGPLMAVRVPELCTERLLLRAFTSADFEPFAEIVADPEVVRYLDDGAPISREECWRGMAIFIGHWQLRGYGWWAGEDRRTGEFLGRIGLYNPEGWPGIEIGWLLRRDKWGAGLATEGATAALTFAFDVVGASHVISLIDPRNTRSIRVAEKLGETYERHLQHNQRDLVVYGIRHPAIHMP